MISISEKQHAGCILLAASIAVALVASSATKVAAQVYSTGSAYYPNYNDGTARETLRHSNSHSYPMTAHCPTSNTQIYPPGMISYWTFDDGTARDVLDHNHGNIVGTPVLVQGRVGYALQFDGVDDGIVVPNSPSLNPAHLTLELWVNYISYKTSWFPRRNMLFDKRLVDVGSYDLDYNGYRDPGNTGGWESDLNVDGTWRTYIQGLTSQIPTNTWYHVVETFDGSMVRLFENGELVRSWPQAGALSPTNTDLYIAKPGHPLDSYSNAVLDEVAIYNRALTAAEIQKHYQKGLHGLGYVETVVVPIDIKPGSGANPINLKSNGKVTVAILGCQTFDVTKVDVSTVLFADATPIAAMTAVEDVNDDGTPDLVLHFFTQELNLQPGDSEACLTGTTLAGQDFAGCDQVHVRK